MKTTVLVNKHYTNKDMPLLLEQYKLITESADRITDRRQTINNYYLGINSFLLSISSYFTLTELFLLKLSLPLIGIGFSIIWIRNINSYKQLNSAKFKVIHELENHLPANIYKKEDEFLKEKYYKLTDVEKKIPVVFIVLYSLLLLLAIGGIIIGKLS